MPDITRHALHCLVYGHPGSKKSTFAATFPKPMLVFAFDPHGKDAPYLRRGTPGDLKTDPYGTPYRIVKSPAGKVNVRLEYYHDVNPHDPNAYDRFCSRMADFADEHDKWATVVMDSATFFELAARHDSKFRVNPTVKDGRQHYAASKEACEQVLWGRLGALPCNVVTIAHISEDTDEGMENVRLRHPALPGKMKSVLSAGYSEFYRAYVGRDEETKERYYELQTEADDRFNAMSQIPAPDPCVPKYEALWKLADKEAGRAKK